MNNSNSDNVEIEDTLDAQKALVEYQSSKSKYSPTNGVELCSCFQKGVDDGGLLQIVKAREQEDRWALLVSPKDSDKEYFESCGNKGFESSYIMLHDIFT